MAELRIRWAVGERTFASDAPVMIGRDPSNSIALSDERVSRVHAELRPGPGGWTLIDHGSTGGTFVGGQRVTELLIRTTTTARLGGASSGEEITIEPIGAPLPGPGVAPTVAPAAAGVAPTVRPDAAPLARPGGVLAPGAAAGATEVVGAGLTVQFAGTTRTLQPGETVTLGRDAAADLHTDNPAVSRVHARIVYADGRWRLEDAGSTRGTFLDGRKVSAAPIEGSTAFWLGPVDVGERLVAVAAGEHKVATSTKARRAAPWIAVGVIGVGLVALAALFFGGAIGSSDDDGPNIADLRTATVYLEAGDFAGSGSIIDAERGLILTNAHVVQPDAPGIGVQYGQLEFQLPTSDDEVLVYLTGDADEPAEPAFIGEVVAVDGYLDLAVVKLTETIGGRIIEEGEDLGLTDVEIGDSEALEQDAEITIIGYPGVSGTASSTVTSGAAAGFVPDRRLNGDGRAWINTDAEIARGNSGGLGADQSGRIVGVPTQELTDQEEPSDSLARLRSIHLAVPLIEAAQQGEEYVSPYVTPIEDEVIDAVGYALPGEQLFELECRNRAADGIVSSQALAFTLDYSGFPTGHQDILVDVEGEDGSIGVVASGDEWPVEWDGEGCAVVTVPLARSLVAGEVLTVYIDGGPNYEVPLFEADVEVPAG